MWNRWRPYRLPLPNDSKMIDDDTYTEQNEIEFTNANAQRIRWRKNSTFDSLLFADFIWLRVFFFFCVFSFSTFLPSLFLHSQNHKSYIVNATTGTFIRKYHFSINVMVLLLLRIYSVRLSSTEANEFSCKFDSSIFRFHVWYGKRWMWFAC